MARAHAHILTAIWADPDWTALGANAQRTYLLLLSQPKLSMVGLLDMLPARWARLAGDTTPDTIRQALDDLEHAGFILVDHNTDELVIRTLVRHDATPAKVANPRWLAGVWGGWEAIESRMLRDAVAAEIPDDVWNSTKVQPPAEAQTTRSGQKLLPEPSKETSAGTSSQNVPQSPVSMHQSTPLSSSDYSHNEPDPPDDDDPAQPPPTIGAAAAVLARRDLHQRQAIPGQPPIGDPVAWENTAYDRRLAAHSGQLAELVEANPDLTADELADLVEPPMLAAVGAGHPQPRPASPLDGQQAAARARAERHLRAVNGEACPHCQDTGLTLDDNGTAITCNHPQAATP